jgi:hypothetical protein
MKNLFYVLSIAVLNFALSACANQSSQDASATTGQPGAAAEGPIKSPEAAKPAANEPGKPAAPRTFVVPAETSITVFL